jgi:hypothetical protein
METSPELILEIRKILDEVIDKVQLSKLTLEKATDDDREILNAITINASNDGLTLDVHRVLDRFNEPELTVDQYGLFKIQYDGKTAGLFRADEMDPKQYKDSQFNEPNRMVELSYIVDPEFRGLGIAPAAMNFYIKEIKITDNIPYLSIMEGNDSSKASLIRYNNTYALLDPTQKFIYKFSENDGTPYEQKYYSTSDATIKPKKRTFTDFDIDKPLDRDKPLDDAEIRNAIGYLIGL